MKWESHVIRHSLWQYNLILMFVPWNIKAISYFRRCNYVKWTSLSLSSHSGSSFVVSSIQPRSYEMLRASTKVLRDTTRVYENSTKLLRVIYSYQRSYNYVLMWFCVWCLMRLLIWLSTFLNSARDYIQWKKKLFCFSRRSERMSSNYFMLHTPSENVHALSNALFSNAYFQNHLCP